MCWLRLPRHIVGVSATNLLSKAPDQRNLARMSSTKPLSRFAFLSILAAIGACEGQTAMLISPCIKGATRACTNTCGGGVQTCEDNSWSVCTVPPTYFTCTNTCGESTRLCQDNRLADLCEVAPVVKDCSSICGTGTETCADNKWGVCTAPLPANPKLTATIRDFHMTFPDMDHNSGPEDRHRC